MDDCKPSYLTGLLNVAQNGPVSVTVPAPLVRVDGAEALYERLTAVLGALGEFQVEVKQTSVHVVAGKAAFLGISPRKSGFRLTVVLSRPLMGTRVLKADQASRARFHNELMVTGPEEFDAELWGWLREAHDLQIAAAR